MQKIAKDCLTGAILLPLGMLATLITLVVIIFGTTFLEVFITHLLNQILPDELTIKALVLHPISLLIIGALFIFIFIPYIVLEPTRMSRTLRMGTRESRDHLLKHLRADGELAKGKLKGLNLAGADLSEARLYNADLRGVDLCGANLELACLGNAIFDSTTRFNEETILPNGDNWHVNYNLAIFTNPNHYNFFDPLQTLTHKHFHHHIPR